MFNLSTDVRCVKPQIGHQQVAPIMNPADEHRREQCASALDISCWLRVNACHWTGARRFDATLDRQRVMGVMLRSLAGATCSQIVVQRKDLARLPEYDLCCLRE